jgi:hypothetical protein
MCTLVTSGQVASKTFRPRDRPPCAPPGRRRGPENHDAIVRHLVEFLDEDRAALAQVVDHEAVVHDLVAHVDRRAEDLQRAVDDIDRPVDAGAEAPGIGQLDICISATPPPRCGECERQRE